MVVLLSSVKREKEKSSSFRALGLAAYAVKDEVLPYLEEIINAIRLCLPVNKDVSTRR